MNIRFKLLDAYLEPMYTVLALSAMQVLSMEMPAFCYNAQNDQHFAWYSEFVTVSRSSKVPAQFRAIRSISSKIIVTTKATNNQQDNPWSWHVAGIQRIRRKFFRLALTVCASLRAFCVPQHLNLY